jgi:CMP-N,N'-diacetyllegionaminic acid synthase
MRDMGKVVVCIPARAGSKRVKAKNLRDLCGQPLLAYAINTAKECFNCNDIYVNSDSLEMLELANSFGISQYLRDPALASDIATGDQFAIDFIRNINVDTLVMISPVCPLITPEDVKNAVLAYQESSCDTLITCETTQMQVFCDGRPVNIELSQQLAPTQNNKIVSTLNWAVTIWDTKQFVDNFEETGSAYIGNNRLLFPVDPTHAIKISNESDFKLAESLIYQLQASKPNA